MPGILLHICFAEEVYKRIKPFILLEKCSFLAGNLIPDLALDKKASHYRKPASREGFVVPDLDLARRELFNPNIPVKFGMFCHLYLDYYFIEEFLIPGFIWDTQNEKVINPRNNKTWDKSVFFSKAGMYGAYAEINNVLLSDGKISYDLLNMIPEILPSTGIAVYDARREKTWKKELNEYLMESAEYTGNIFDYDRLWHFIEKTAIQLAEEVAKY